MIDRKRQVIYALVAGATYIIGHADAISSLLPQNSRWVSAFGGLVAVCTVAMKAFATDPERKPEK